MPELIVNRNRVHTSVPPGTVLLDVLRDELGLKGTKEGCREGDCGACTVLVGERIEEGLLYRSAASCLVPVGALHGQHVVTIEGLTGTDLSPVQQALVDEGATQCGFCTPGIVVALTGFLLGSPSLGMDDALAAVEGNICRCTGYVAIRRAAERLVAQLEGMGAPSAARTGNLIQAGLLPAYFGGIPEALETIEPLAAKKPAGANAVRVAGGTDLFVQQADRLREARLHFPGAGTRGIRRHQDTLIMAADTPVEDLLRSDLLRTTFPCWDHALRLVSSTLIRNRATVAGNIVNASPIGDLSILLLALRAELTIQTRSGTRTTPLDRFWHGYKTFDLGEDEWITEIVVPVPGAETRVHFEKVSRREHLDIASVNTACLMTVNRGIIDHALISAGGVAPTPLLLRKSSASLSGRPLAPATVRDLLPVVDEEIAPISDVRGTDRYKRSLLRRLIIAHFAVLAPDLDLSEVTP